MACNTPTNSDDVIDSRDIIERMEELESERQDLVDAIGAAKDKYNNSLECNVRLSGDLLRDLEHANFAILEWDGDNTDELKALRALAKEGEYYAADWIHGATLIRESYFTDYCEELVSDIGDMPRDIPGYIVIDWEATARNLRADYTEIDFDGVTYFVR